jgi:hypothetical protein
VQKDDAAGTMRTTIAPAGINSGRRFAEALSPPRHRVFQTPPYNAERVANRYLHGIVLLARSRIVIHVDIGAAFNRKPDAKPVWIAREMLGPRRRDNDRRRRYFRTGIAKIFHFAANEGFNRIGMLDAIEGDLD